MKWWKYLAGILTVLFVTVVIVAALNPTYKSEIAFLDVDQGDSVLITDSTGYQILVDSGNDRRVLYQLEKVMPLFDRSINMLIATHPDADHIGGFVSVLEKYNVQAVVDNNVPKDTEQAQSFRDTVLQKSIRHMNLYEGDEVTTPGGISLLVLHPDRGYKSSEANNHSIVLLVRYKRQSVLLTGDIDNSVEQGLVQNYNSGLHSRVLKMAHHGSRTSSSAPFLDAVRPDVAVATYGCDNNYGHPHKATVYRYTVRRIPVVTTCDFHTMILDLESQDVIFHKARYRLF